MYFRYQTSQVLAFKIKKKKKVLYFKQFNALTRCQKHQWRFFLSKSKAQTRSWSLSRSAATYISWVLDIEDTGRLSGEDPFPWSSLGLRLKEDSFLPTGTGFLLSFVFSLEMGLTETWNIKLKCEPRQQWRQLKLDKLKQYIKDL